jgi:hypothetical protein
VVRVTGVACVGEASLRAAQPARARSSALLASCVCVLLACHDPLIARGGRLFDAQGRELLLRGVNARVEGIFDVSFDDGRIALEPIPPFGAADCRFLSRELGLNFLRLPVSWSAFEPEPGAYNAAYLARILELAEACGREGVGTLVDLHQDAYSKEIGEDGAPLWAIVPPPTQLLQGPLEDLTARRLSRQVVLAFRSLFLNTSGVQDAYAAMAAELARGLRDQPHVLGLELMNEPFELTLDDPQAAIDAFHARVGAAVRAAAPRLTLFFEPDSRRNLNDTAAVNGPSPFRDAVYAPHLYTGVFVPAPDDAGAIARSLENAAAEAAALRSAARRAGSLRRRAGGGGPRRRACLAALPRHDDRAQPALSMGAASLLQPRCTLVRLALVCAPSRSGGAP